MSTEIRISAEPRTEFGKGGARRTRRAGKVPAVLYGHGTDARHISLPVRELAHAFKTGGGSNVLLTLALEEGTELALPRQVQRDPIRGDFIHIDLLLVRRGEKVAVDVPVRLIGEAIGVKTDGGMVDHQIVGLRVEAEATAIPDHVDVDITNLHVGDSVTAGQIVLPEGTTLLVDPDVVVVHVVTSRVEAEAAEADAETAAAVAAAAPAVEAEAPEGEAKPGEAPEGAPASGE